LFLRARIREEDGSFPWRGQTTNGRKMKQEFFYWNNMVTGGGTFVVIPCEAVRQAGIPGEQDRLNIDIRSEQADAEPWTHAPAFYLLE
jgi:hypothetical protein